jgi:hypothetical protein
MRREMTVSAYSRILFCGVFASFIGCLPPPTPWSVTPPLKLGSSEGAIQVLSVEFKMKCRGLRSWGNSKLWVELEAKNHSYEDFFRFEWANGKVVQGDKMDTPFGETTEGHYVTDAAILYPHSSIDIEFVVELPEEVLVGVYRGDSLAVHLGEMMALSDSTSIDMPVMYLHPSLR